MEKLLLGHGVMALLLLAVAGPAQAYLGPGGVISGIGSFLALIAAVILAIIGFLWFPIKRLIKRKRGLQRTADDMEKTSSPEEDS